MAVDILKKFESHGTISVRLCAAGSIPVLGQPVISEGRFRLADEVRGRLAEEILATFLARGGYRVTPVGIERLFGQAKYLNQQSYLALDLPEQLRTLPDFLITDLGITWAKLIEVKFRSSFSRNTADELFAELTKQRRFWPESYAIIFLGKPFLPDGRFQQDYIRVIPPGQTELLRVPRGITKPADQCEAMQLLWEKLPTLLALFKSPDFEPFGDERGHREQEFWREADSITSSIRGLARS